MAVVLCQGDRGPGSWKGLEIGYPFVLRYEGHRLWEERVPLWPVNRYRGLWVTLTPDYYKYVEDCSCPGGEGGPVDLQLFRAPLAPGGFRQPDGLGKVYCFANRPDVIELRDLIRDAFGLAVQEADYVQEIPGHVYDPSGQEVTLDYFFGGNFLAGCLHGPGAREAPPPAPVDGRKWYAADPLHDSDWGTEVALDRLVHVVDGKGIFRRPGGTPGVCVLVKPEEVPALVAHLT